MFKIEWDTDTGGVILTSQSSDNNIGISPRPVFKEELIMLALDSNYGWLIPNTDQPLLWACNKSYYYKGRLAFTVKGGNMFSDSTVDISEWASNLNVVPIDVNAMIERNKEKLFLIESEAIEFIRDTYSMYSKNKSKKETFEKIDFEQLALLEEKKSKKRMAIIKQDCDSFDIMPLELAEQSGKKIYQTAQKIDKFIASFSGGKDSQVLLDLCTRALPPAVFEVIYSDTGYELPTSLELYKETQERYSTQFPNLKFSTAKNHNSVLRYWDTLGTPSDKQRWCCAVMKTAPLYRMLKIEGSNKQAKVLAFEGVRAEESHKRSTYSRIGKAVKHNTSINARPIINWNTVEIFLYLFKYKLPINLAYKQGKARVGCLICPYSSQWDDMIAQKYYKNELEPFVSRIRSLAAAGGVKDIEQYIKDRNWKFRASGNLLSEKSSISFEQLTPDFVAKLTNPKKDVKDWLITIGEYTTSEITDGIQTGEIRFRKNIYSFNIEYRNDSDRSTIFTLRHANNPILIGLLRRVLYKTTYCVNCEVCEVECPTGALSIVPQVNINKSECIHCCKCLEFHDKGCIAACSLARTNNTNMKNKTGIDRYNTFGLRDEWVDMFFTDNETFWDNHGLGTKQVPAFKNWLKEAGILDEKNVMTSLGSLLSKVYLYNRVLVWEIMWINLFYNSFIAGWFCKNIKNGDVFTKNYLREMIQNQYEGIYGNRTIDNALSALLGTFKKSPIGNELQLVIPIDKSNSKRNNYETLNVEAVAYSLYKYAETKNITNIRVSDLYNDGNEYGIHKEFYVSKESLEKSLRILNSQTNRILIAELNMGLDHINLRDDLTSLNVLEILLESQI